MAGLGHAAEVCEATQLFVHAGNGLLHHRTTLQPRGEGKGRENMSVKCPLCEGSPFDFLLDSKSSLCAPEIVPDSTERPVVPVRLEKLLHQGERLNHLST